MTVSFYIDESGHSGDLVKTGNAYDFLDQPYFALACVGVEDEERLAHLVTDLKLRHRLPHGELKSKGLVVCVKRIASYSAWPGRV